MLCPCWLVLLRGEAGGGWQGVCYSLCCVYHTIHGILPHILPSISMVDSVACLRYAECSRAPGHVIRDMVARCRLLAACVVWYAHGARSWLPIFLFYFYIGEDPAAHGHWCTFTDLYHTIRQPLSEAGPAECSHAPDYVINGYGCPMQTIASMHCPC